MTRDRARVRHVGQQRAEQHRHLDAERLGQVDDRARERRASGIAGSGPESSTRSRGARGMRTAWISNSGQSIVARDRRPPAGPSGAWTGSRRTPRGRSCANGSAPRLPAMNGQRRRRRLAGVVPALEGADQRRGPKAVGTAFPAQRLHESTVPRPPRRPSMGDMSSRPRGGHDRRPARRGRRRRRLRLLAQGPADGALGHARTWRSSCATGRGAIQARAFRDADVLAGRFERGDLVRVAGRVERFRDELQLEVRDDRRAPSSADPAAFLPVAYRDVDELDGLPRAPRARGPRRRPTAGCSSGCSATTRCAPQWRRAPCTRGGHHAYLGGLLEHTVAVGTLGARDAPSCTRV